MRWRRRARPESTLRACVATLLAAGGLAVAAAVVPATPAAAYGATVTIVGRGNGHGDGLSQWGAYGYAPTRGWDWHQILDHYYGGTTEDVVDPTTEVKVRLRTLDDATSTTVVNARRNLSVNADPGAATNRWGSVVAVEVGNGVYRVYARPDAQCPVSDAPADLERAGSGWTVVSAAYTSVSTGGVPLEVVAAGVDQATADRGALVGVCRPDGTVRAYRGGVIAVNGTAGENRTINRVRIDQYLRGVVPRESPASWGSAAGGAGMNALRAQAVAARTYALAERRYTYAQTCDTDACQVYGGAANLADGPSGTVTVLEDGRTDTAVADASGVVLRTAAGALAYTQFNSSSGGITSGANFPSVVDEGDAVAANPHHRWTQTFDRHEIEAAFPTIGSLANIDVTKRNGLGEWGGRVVTVVVRGTTATVTLTGQQFASALGLRSSWFDVPAGCSGPEAFTTTPAPSLQLFHRLAPQRLVDTREGRNATTAPVAAGCVLALRPADLADLPTGASAVSLNLTVTNPAVAGYATVYPCDRGLPLASTINYRAGQTVANQVVVPLDGNAEVCVYSLQRADVVIDLLGWFGGAATGAGTSASTPAVPAGERFSPLTPARLADTRTGLGGTAGPLPASAELPVSVLGAGGVPTGQKATAVVLNVTSTGTGANGYVTVYACGETRPLASNLNPVVGTDVAAHVVAPVSADGRVCLYTLQPTHLVVDIMGWYGGAAPAAQAFESLPPSRVLDTRSTGGALLAGAPGRALAVTGVGGVPTGPGVKAVVLNVTATAADGPGFVTVYPCDDPFPASSNLNYAAGLDVANMVTVPVGPSGTVCLYSHRNAHVVVDLAGWYGTR